MKKLSLFTLGLLALACLSPSCLAQTNAVPARKFSPPNAIILQAPESPRAGLKPGLYATQPYAGIVLVPPTRVDERALVNPPPMVPSMRMITPELHFTPIAPRPNVDPGLFVEPASILGNARPR